MEPGTLRQGRREQALADEIPRAAYLSDGELCLVKVRKLLNLWERPPEYPLPGKPTDRADSRRPLATPTSGKRSPRKFTGIPPWSCGPQRRSRPWWWRQPSRAPRWPSAGEPVG